MYAIVRQGGRQHKVAVGDVLEVDKVNDLVGTELSLTALLLVDGADVTVDKTALAAVKVTAPEDAVACSFSARRHYNMPRPGFRHPARH